MCRKSLLILYKSFISRNGIRVPLIEQWVSFENEDERVYCDEKRNEPETYSILFSDECRASVENLFLKVMWELRGQPYERCKSILEALAFLQEIVATALWKYNCSVGATLEMFAREFDRLDLQVERERLHAQAQSA